MKKIITTCVLACATLLVSGCSMFGSGGVEIAPYRVLEQDEKFELRHYDSLILVSTPMSSLDEDRSPFYKLFNYISGDNDAEQDIAMTAPVFMDQADGETETMSFVLPKDFSMADAPIPQNPDVKLEEITDYTVATITFNGLLRQGNIQKHQALLEDWIQEKNWKKTGPAKAAGYNPPFTIPALRRNEILIPVEKP
jgi:hypothetical protein